MIQFFIGFGCGILFMLVGYLLSDWYEKQDIKNNSQGKQEGRVDDKTHPFPLFHPFLLYP